MCVCVCVTCRSQWTEWLMLYFLIHSFIYISIEMMQHILQLSKWCKQGHKPTVIYSYHCFHKLHSGNAETGAGQASPTTSGQSQSHMDRWPPQDTASNGMCAEREEEKNLAKIRHTWAFLKVPALTDGNRALTHGMDTERWRKSL